MQQKQWTITTSCYPYSNDLLIDDGSDLYACSVGCETCGCEVARIDSDAEDDGEGGMRNLTRYFCADCRSRLGGDEVMLDVTRDTLTQAVAASMFRGFSPLKTMLLEAFATFGVAR